MGALLDMLADIAQAHHTVDVVTATVVKKVSVPRARRVRCWILSYLRYDDWRSARDVAEASGRNPNSVAVALSMAKRRGLVTNEHGAWRKMPIP
jgi:predicted transcriptional regulator